jgi:hydrogenase nickel incorporation protein HypA/HybF
MHELSVCQGLLREVQRVARAHRGARVTAIRLRIGPLSGVEPHLLEQAFPIAAAGTLAEDSALLLDRLPIQVRCAQCGATTGALPNRLVCGQCGDWRTTLLSGDELQLVQVELARETAACSPSATRSAGARKID